MFHAKVYLFTHRNGRRAAWIGSANFTAKGFGYNKEVMLEVTDKTLVSNVRDWFEAQWNTYPWDDAIYEGYIRSYRERERSDAFDQRSVEPDDSQVDYLRDVRKIVFRPDKYQGGNYRGEISYFVSGERRRFIVLPTRQRLRHSTTCSQSLAVRRTWVPFSFNRVLRTKKHSRLSMTVSLGIVCRPRETGCGIGETKSRHRNSWTSGGWTRTLAGERSGT